MSKPILNEEKCKTKIELEEMSDGTWQVREIKIFSYDNPLAARNKVEHYMYEKLDEEKRKTGTEILRVTDEAEDIELPFI